MTTLTDERLAARLTDEIEALALEVFSTTYGCEWQRAIDTAIADLPDLIAYADTWNGDAFLCGNDAAWTA
jgi:hypothetical protein